MKSILLTLLLLLAARLGAEARVDTLGVKSVNVPSPAKVAVAVPDRQAPKGGWPSLYLLHGYTGDYSNWARKTDLDSLANLYGTVIVCPDGYNSWYWDTPAAVKADSKMESYITGELVPEIDRIYGTSRRAGQRAIAGLSMGGHGAVWLGARHPDLFGAIGSMSGALDLEDKSIRGGAGTAELLGPYEKSPKAYATHSAMSVIPKIKASRQPLIIACGTEDFIFSNTEHFHDALRKAGVPHTYVTRPGAHTWEFWTTSLPHFLQFFRDNRR